MPTSARATKNRSAAARRAHMTRRILAVWEQVTEQDIAEGQAWYARATEWAREQGIDVVTAAGVLAALSPRCKWSTNQKWARDVLTAAAEGKNCPAVHTTTMREQAWRIANGEHPLSVLNGPKVRAFYANITGDSTVVTVDIWAARIAEGWKYPQPDAESRVTRARNRKGDGRQDEKNPSGARYRMIADAYRQAALIAGVAPSTLQAAVWVNVRGAAS